MSDRSEKIKILEEVYKKHHKLLCNHALNLIGDMDTAQDIVQEVFVKVWKNMERIEMGDYFKYYLLKATTSTSLNYLERNKRLTRVKEEVKISMTQNGHTNDDPAHLQELKSSIRKAIDKLPPKCKTVYLLCRQEDLSYKEVADQLDISVKTVENQMGIALKKLRADLSDYLLLPMVALPVVIYFIWMVLNS